MLSTDVLGLLGLSSVFFMLDWWSKKEWSPKWRRSKFGKMSPDDIMEYVHQNEDNRKEVRDKLEKEYEWYEANAPEGMIKRMNVSWTRKNIDRGKDPFDRYYRGRTNSKSLIAITSIVTLLLQFFIWLEPDDIDLFNDVNIEFTDVLIGIGVGVPVCFLLYKLISTLNKTD